MFGAFKNRRPWAAALVSFVFSPIVGMLYLNRGWYAFCYLMASFAIAGCVLELNFTFLPHFDLNYRIAFAEFPIRIVGAIHAYILAKQLAVDVRLKWYAHWYSIIAILVAPFAIALAIRAFLFQTFDIPSASMEPSANPGDYFLVSKIAYDFAQPQRGDVVVLRGPQGSYFIKRIVGLPGDKVQMQGGTLFINGIRARQRQITDWAENCGRAEPCDVSQYEEVLPGGRIVHILNRMDFGPWDDTDLFVVPVGKYFVLGDNRDNSEDSRNGLGFVARDNLIGRAGHKFFVAGHLTWAPIQ